MLILLPASDSKTTVRRGKRLDPADLPFPPLAPTRAAVPSEHFDVDLRRPERPGRTWRLHVVEPRA